MDSTVSTERPHWVPSSWGWLREKLLGEEDEGRKRLS